MYTLSVYNTTSSITFLGSKIWKFIPTQIRNKKPLKTFKLAKDF